MSKCSTAPKDQLRPVLTLYFHPGMNDKEIASSVMDHFDPVHYGLRYIPMLYNISDVPYLFSVFTVRRRRKEWCLESTRKQKHTVQSIAAHVDEVKKHFSNRGAETVRKALFMENKIPVPRCVPHST
jgi:hypothetical protein